VRFQFSGNDIGNKLKLNNDTTIIAEKLIASGDLYAGGCNCGKDYKIGEGNLVDMVSLIHLMIDTIEVFGEAGLRELSALAKARADGLSLLSWFER
jgi:hypothetical protein